MKTYFFFLFVTFVVLSGCLKDSNKTKNGDLENCLENEAFEIANKHLNCSNFSLNTTYFCDIIDLDTVLKLTTSEKEWLPNYCSDLGEDIYYLDENGNETKFVVLDKSANKFLSVQNSGEICTNDSLKNIANCFRFEMAKVTVYSDLLDMKFNIELKPVFWNKFSSPEKSIALISINTVENTDSIYFIKVHLRAVLGNGVEEYPYSIINKHFDEIDILGKTFYDVYTYENAFNNDYIKMYYNSKYGIVSFIDDSGKQWRIKTE